MNVATICYLFKTMVNFANMLLNRFRLCYTWTLVWTWRKTPIAKLFLFFFFSLYLWVINNSLAQYIHLNCFTVTHIKGTSCMYYAMKTIFSCDLRDFQYPFVLCDIPSNCRHYVSFNHETCELQVYHQKRR